MILVRRFGLSKSKFTYGLQCGFLDGLEGLIIAYMAAFYTFLKYSKARNMS